MVPEPSKRPLNRALDEMRENEVRWPLGLSNWKDYHSHIPRIEVERVGLWSLDQIQFNTTMEIGYSEGTSPRPIYLKYKQFHEHTQPVGQFDLHTFTTSPDRASEQLRLTIDLLHNLSNRARQLGFQSWSDLPHEHLPRSWEPRILNHKSAVPRHSGRPAISLSTAVRNVPMKLLYTQSSVEVAGSHSLMPSSDTTEDNSTPTDADPSHAHVFRSDPVPPANEQMDHNNSSAIPKVRSRSADTTSHPTTSNTTRTGKRSVISHKHEPRKRTRRI